VKTLGASKIFCEKTTLLDQTKKDYGALLEILFHMRQTRIANPVTAQNQRILTGQYHD